MRSSPLLLDTCAAIWIANDEPIADSARQTLANALLADETVFVSPITAWEVGMLAARGRLRLRTTAETWFARFLAKSGVELADMSPRVLIASSYLPDEIQGDPADRIVVATAREYDMEVVTRDRRLLSYARAGFCRALAC